MRLRLLAATVALSAAILAESRLPLPESGNVTMPLDEYNKLVGLAARPPKKVEKPPFPSLLKSAQMKFAVEGESVSGSVTLEGEVLAEGDRRVPLVSGMVVLDARQKGPQGKDVELPIEQEAGVLSGLLSGPGEFALTLQAALPLTIETGRASFQLPVPAAGAARLTLSVPGEQTLVTLDRGLITRRSSAGGRTTIEATLVPGQPANFWWAARLAVSQAPAAPKEVRFLSDVKTLISVGESELGLAALTEITVVQGEPEQFTVEAPAGYELTGATGATLASSEMQPNGILLRVNNPAVRNHQFLISMAKANPGGKAEIPLPAFLHSQRETGEVMIEGEGAIELTATGGQGLRRMDLKESSPYLRALARAPIHAAFRYQKRAETPAVALEWVRFPDSAVLSAVAQRAVVTTLVTCEGRTLTEVKLTVINRAQPFLKVALPAGANILSAGVAGEKVKPVEGADGNRVPLLRTGYRPTGAYEVTFVFLHAGAPFQKKGGAELALPKMDIPIGVVEWEVFLPEQYKVADFGGDAIPARLLAFHSSIDLDVLSRGEIGGIITDPAGGVVAGARVTVRHRDTGATFESVADAEGHWMVPQVPAGQVRITAAAPGFQATARDLNHDASAGTRISLALQIGSVSESVTVTASTGQVMRESQQVERNARQNAATADVAASTNVKDLQRRVVGVLPIAVNVPHTGASYHFVRPLVVDEETHLTFAYKSNYRSK